MRCASVGAGMPSGLNCGFSFTPLRSSDLLPLGALSAHLGGFKIPHSAARLADIAAEQCSHGV